MTASVRRLLNAWSVTVLALAADLPVVAASSDGFEVHSNSQSWKAAMELVPDGLGGFAVALTGSFPGHTVSQAGEYVAMSVPVCVPPTGPADLSFRFTDSFTGPTAGYHFAEILIDAEVLFRRDVAGGTIAPEAAHLDLRKAMPQGGRASLTFRWSDSRAVSNFPVSVSFLDPVLTTAAGQHRLLPPAEIHPPTPLPPDPPLPSLALTGQDWAPLARIVQPWGATQWDAIVNAKQRASWLASEFGFNAVILLPPEAHNAITAESHHVTESQFEEALASYRAAGFRIILYSSIMHCGHAPVWQQGNLTKTRPEWSQRGPKGDPVTLYGAEWLCPNTGALSFTIEYTRGIQRRHQPDAVMLDNNEFFSIASGLTCHCSGCLSDFCAYLKARFGETALGQPARSVRIPTEPGPLYNLWLHWRNRVWGKATEQFRVELRKQNPEIVVLANTQYLRASPDLATDLQYGHEDAVLSESRNKSADRMIDKLLLGQALAKERPLWNYLGTFQGADFGRLISAEGVSMNVSTTHACRARPWVVYYGFLEQPDANAAALDRLAKTLRWHGAKDAELDGLSPFAPVLSLVSLTSRNCQATQLIPSHLTPLRKMGVCSRLVDERGLENGASDEARVLLVESAPCLSERTVGAIAVFVQRGGVLITSTDLGLYDEIGRPRPKSPIWTKLGLSQAPTGMARCGEGQVVITSLPAPWDHVAEWLEPARFILDPQADASVLPYVDRDGQLVVYVCADGPLPEPMCVIAPDGFSGTAVICSPDQPEPRIIDLLTR